MNTRLLLGAAGALLLAAGLLGVVIHRDLVAIRAGQAEIRSELQQLREGTAPRRAAAQAPASAQNQRVDISNRPAAGNEGAPVTLVEFSDFECPYCGRHVRDTMPQIEAAYIVTGKVRYVFRHLPLESIHKAAFQAHRVAACAFEQGRFWPMHDRLFSNQKALGDRAFDRDVDAVGLNNGQFQTCLGDSRVNALIRADIADAERLGITGTPTFLIGRSDPARKTVLAERVLSGAQPFSRFREAIDALLQ
jgi:protein-disulfide isomerase